jgi:putative MATE family efflux protein
MPALLSFLREAFNGEEKDFTTGSLRRAIALLAAPMMLETAMESLFAIVDIFFVAQLGDDAVATVGLTESLLTFVFAIAMGLSFATTAYVARRIGEKDPAAAAHGATHSLYIGIAASAVIGITGLLFAPQLLALMGASPAMQANQGYTRVALGGSASVMLLFLLNAIFRGAGDAVIAMKVLWFGNLINIVLNPCLIFGWGPFPELGVTGSAVGTVIGRSAAVAYQVWQLSAGSGRIRFTPEALRFSRPLLARLLRPASSGMFQIFVATASWTALIRIAATFGADVLAGYTIAIRIVIFSILPSWGLANAAATLVGQNLGASQPLRAETSVWTAARYNCYFLGALSLVLLAAAEPLLALFTPQPAVIAVGSECLRWVAAAYVCLAYGMTMEQAFNGAGDTYTPTLLNLACYWLLQIPLAWALAIGLGWGPRGIFSAITVAETALGLAAVAAFRRGAWQRQRI